MEGIMKKYFLFGIMIIPVLIRCSSMKIMANYDREVDFSQYQTFQFVGDKDSPGRGGKGIHNPLFTKDVMYQIRPVMEAKGFTEVENRDEADILIHFNAFVKNRREYVPPTYRIGRWRRVWRARPGHVVDYKEGTLIIDIVDRARKEMVWQGVGQGVLDRDNPARNLAEAASDILAHFPPAQ